MITSDGNILPYEGNEHLVGLDQDPEEEIELEEGEKIITMNFGQAIEALKEGKKVTRKGWNGKGMFLWLKPAAKVKAEWCKDPLLKELADANGGEIDALGTICMFTADKKILSGWLASQTDMLSEDWQLVESLRG